MRSLALSLVVLTTTLAGCAGDQPGGGGPGGAAPSSTPNPNAPTAGKAIKIGAVLPMFSHPFFISQQQGLEDAAKALGATIDVRDGQDDDLKQINQVETLINLGVDAIILCPRDGDALIPAVEAANRAKIPVITMNRRVNGGQFVTYVGADDAQGGEAQGQALVDALGAKGGKIIYLQGTQGSSPQRSRREGLLKILAKHPTIQIVDDRFADFQEDKAKSVMTDLVQKYRPGDIQAIVAQADEMALPAAEVAHGTGWKDVAVIGFNGTRAAFEAIQAGQLHATVLQDAAEQGKLAVEKTVEHLKGQTVAPEVFTTLPVVTKANVAKLKPSY